MKKIINVKCKTLIEYFALFVFNPPSRSASADEKVWVQFPAACGDEFNPESSDTPLLAAE